MNGFRGKIFSIYGKNGAIKYITHLDKFSYFPKHYNFHETMLYSQYPFENFQVEISVLSYNLKYSDEMTVSQNNFNIYESPRFKRWLMSEISNLRLLYKWKLQGSPIILKKNLLFYHNFSQSYEYFHTSK